MRDYLDIKSKFLKQIENAAALSELEEIRIAALGRKGQVTELMKSLGRMSIEERQTAGSALNGLKKAIIEAIKTKRTALEKQNLEEHLSSEAIDLTLPVASQPRGTIHPVSQVVDELTVIFGAMGFNIVEGPDIEDDWHNFTALNIPAEHPARQMHDTFYLMGTDEKGSALDRKVLRTHTSPVQVRSMMSQKPPIRIIVPGRTYRSDSDQTHTPMFHQVEGLVIDKSSHMGHLKGCLIEFTRRFFDIDDLSYRFRPSYFPFTEPSAEMDIGCFKDGNEIRIGGTADWLEILGCGMVNPRVLANCGIDPDHFQGFAFGMGVDRIGMLKYGMPDLRSFFESDLRWLRHFGFRPLNTLGLMGR